MKIVSYMEDGKDVFCFLIEKLKETQRQISSGAILKKIYLYLKGFFAHQRPDGVSIKCVQGSIYEMRILVAGTWYVARTFFHREKDKLILLTASLVKPRIYDTKQTTKNIEHVYTVCIEKSQKIVQDYLTSKNYTYAFISLL